MNSAEVFRMALMGLGFIPVLVPVACQSDGGGAEGSPEAVFGTSNFRADHPPEVSSAESQEIPKREGLKEGGDGHNTTDRSLSGTRDASRTRTSSDKQQNQPVTPDLSRLKSVRRKSRKQLKKARTTWPEKFDRQARNRLQKHMKKRGWEKFEYSNNEEGETSGQQDGSTNQKNQEEQEVEK